MLDEPLNKGMKEYVKELLRLYTSNPAWYENDNNWNGFEWVNCNDSERSVYSFIRKTADDKKKFLFVLNMTPVKRESYTVGVDSKKKWKLLLNSDEKKYGGNGSKIAKEIAPTEGECDSKPYTLTFDLPAFTALVFEL